MTDQERSSLSGIVLAGGQSQRMGRNKALLELEGQTLIARVLERLSPLCDELIISANDVELYADLPAQVVPDLIPGRGALGGIHAGLATMRHDKAVVVACDMPFLSLPLLRYMVVVSSGYDVVVPRVNAFFEPLHAVYSARCVEPIAQLIAEGPRRVVDLYRQVRLREVTEADVRLFDAALSFVNVNTQEEWTEVQRLIKSGRCIALR
jgi:molybdopterin-guanine dinucleotide biosynthesis protein A